MSKPDNPLRRLRCIISERDRPLSQRALAARLHCSPAWLQAIENGRRPLSEQFLFAIWLWLGLRWDGEEWCSS